MQIMNPVLVKEFRGRMRTVKMPLLLVAYLLVVGGIIFGYMYLRYANQVFFRPGESKELFMMLAVLQLILIAFVAPGLTAGTISGERERQTLNILLTTHLSPAKIVLSKLTSSLAFSMLLVFATLPVYAIVFLYGGISPSQLVGVFAMYLMAMLLFGSVGIFCSAWFKRTGVSTVVAYGVTMLLLGGTALVSVFILQYISMHSAQLGNQAQYPEVFFWAALNPVLNLISLFEPSAVMLGQNGGVSAQQALPMQPTLYFGLVYIPISALLLFFSVRTVSPIKKKLFSRTPKRGEEAR
ncbi:ABC transporter permease [Tumebacillus permanentifrigoris]|uniref:ABC-type transport system involved in multi-copper enzyme maturation permease subunit n=1 Tax=Tumebacillus permanentifrigoris TaxID=378543 RepID=A0A316D840_9BACL|nr:ABC transporter permease [Tumebacillus permanentifrigoris]PWK12836.1 ABC-type transport system involved in multi-copper enzyme maturation permease subunit [Tumebacillus permanentifrigoris]